MSQLEKALQRISTYPSDYTYTEARWLLRKLDFGEYNKGKTSGSRVKFYRESDGKIILLHKPHPSDVMSKGAVKDLVNLLKEMGELK